jgi:hypothetical protein
MSRSVVEEKTMSGMGCTSGGKYWGYTSGGTRAGQEGTKRENRSTTDPCLHP